MTPSSTHQLRLGLERLSTKHLKSIRGQVKVQPLHAMIAIPIPERLILLALLDGVEARTIKQLVKGSDADVQLISPRMVEATRLLERAINDPLWWIDAGPEATVEVEDLTDRDAPFAVVDRLVPRTTERSLRAIFYPSANVMLFGDAAPASLGRQPLRSRLCLYLALVESYHWRQIQEVLGCSEWAIRIAIKQAQEQLGRL